MSRLFVAAWPPGVRWIPRERWHVTLAFLGEQDEAAALEALERLGGVAAEAELGPRVARLGRDVVCVPVRGLDALAAAVGDAFGTFGLPSRPFRGHLTLARLRHRAVCDLVGAVALHDPQCSSASASWSIWVSGLRSSPVR